MLSYTAFLVLFGNTVCQGREWTRLESPRAILYTDAGTKAGLRILEQLETMAAAFEEYGRRIPSQRPRVLLFSSGAEFAEFRPSKISTGFYQSSPSGDWIVLPVSGNQRVVLHEYTHLLLNRGTTRLPQWLEEGLAEYFSTMRVADGKLTLGEPIAEHQRLLTLLGPLSAKELVEAGRNSVHYEDARLAARFYATSWALVHMLYGDPQFAARMPEFVTAIDQNSEPPEAAFERVFGSKLDEAVRLAVPRMARSQPAVAGSFSRPAPGASLETRSERRATPVEILLLQAELLLDSGKRAEAAKRYERIARIGNQEAQVALAYAALAEGRTAEALQRFGALAADPEASDRTVFEYAMLLRDSKPFRGAGSADRETVTQLLYRTIRLNPAHPEAQFLLGVRATDERRYSEAVEHLRQATASLPRQASFWHALGFAEAKLGHPKEAREAALKAARMAESEEEIHMAEELLALTGAKVGAAAGPAKPPVSAPASWTNRKGDAFADGTLHRFVCPESPGAPPAIEIKTVRGVERFLVLEPTKLEIRNGTGAKVEFPCGSLEPRAVRIEYQSSNRDVTALEFRP